MKFLTVVLLLILLLLSYDMFIKDSLTTERFMSPLLAAQINHAVTTKAQSEEAKEHNSEQIDEVKNTINDTKQYYNTNVCKNYARFYDFNNLVKKEFDQGIVIQPNELQGNVALGMENKIVYDLQNECEPTEFISDKFATCDTHEFSCIDATNTEQTYPGGKTIYNNDGQLMCRYEDCAQRCDTIKNDCFKYNLDGGYVEDIRHYSDCIVTMCNNCELLDREDNRFDSNVINLCPNETYYYVDNANGGINNRVTRFYKDKTSESLDNGRRYMCEYQYKPAHSNTSRVFGSLNKVNEVCGNSKIPKDLQCFTYVSESNNYMFHHSRPYDVLQCRYHVSGECYFPMSNAEDNVVLCDYNRHYNPVTKECTSPIQCSKPYYVPTTTEQNGDTFIQHYEKRYLSGSYSVENNGDGHPVKTVCEPNIPEEFPPDAVFDLTCEFTCDGNHVTGTSSETRSTATCTVDDCPDEGTIVARRRAATAHRRIGVLAGLQSEVSTRANMLTQESDALSAEQANVEEQIASLTTQRDDLQHSASVVQRRREAVSDLDARITEKLASFAPITEDSAVPPSMLPHCDVSNPRHRTITYSNNVTSTIITEDNWNIYEQPCNTTWTKRIEYDANECNKLDNRYTETTTVDTFNCKSPEECYQFTPECVRDPAQDTTYYLRNNLSFLGFDDITCDGIEAPTMPSDEGSVCCQINSWEPWSECSASCGGGTQSRTRTTEGAGCPSDLILTETQACNTQACIPDINCEVSPWTNDGSCSVQCGVGKQRQVRTVTVPHSGNGEVCPSLTQEIDCDTGIECIPDTNCEVSPWSPWGDCSESCGGGTQTKTRSVTQQPQGNGTACPTDLEESRECNTQACPVVPAPQPPAPAPAPQPPAPQPPAPQPPTSTPSAEPVLPAVPELNRSVAAHIVEGYPVIHRTSATSIDVYIAFSTVCRAYWLCLPKLPEREITLADVVINGPTFSDRVGLGVITNVSAINHRIPLNDTVVGTEYRMLVVLNYHNNLQHWSDVIEFDISA